MALCRRVYAMDSGDILAVRVSFDCRRNCRCFRYKLSPKGSDVYRWLFLGGNCDSRAVGLANDVCERV